MYSLGSVVMAQVQFTDTFEIKRRPVLILYEEYGNIVVLGITSNKNMKGIPLLKKDGMIKDSVIKTNYIFTISEKMIDKYLFTLDFDKRNKIYNDILNKLDKFIK